MKDLGASVKVTHNYFSEQKRSLLNCTDIKIRLLYERSIGKISVFERDTDDILFARRVMSWVSGVRYELLEAKSGCHFTHLGITFVFYTINAVP